ncbi:hypothetical protein, partial [Rhizobium leguminosarum]|uniref:hypothetical protein n=1 Tax=Rhizobium leguminosarum TaxID=384 RepID=UPI003F9BAB9A
GLCIRRAAALAKERPDRIMERIAAPSVAAAGPEVSIARQDSTVAIVAFVGLAAALVLLFPFPPIPPERSHIRA